MQPNANANAKTPSPTLPQGVLVAYFDTTNLPTFTICTLASLVFFYVSSEILEATWSEPNSTLSIIFNLLKLSGAILTFKVTEAAVNIVMAVWVMLAAVRRGLRKLEKRRGDQDWRKGSY